MNPLAQDVLVQLLGFGLWLDAQLSPEDFDAVLVLAKRGVAPAELHVEAHQRAVHGLLQRVESRGLLKRRGRQRTDSTHVLAAVRTLNRLERVGETLRAALNALAVVAPDWLRAQAPLAWYDRYGQRVENYALPKTEAARRDLAASIGADGQSLLKAIDTSDQTWLAEVPAVQVLRQVWAEQYIGDTGELRWREVKEMPPPAQMIASPYDPEARYSTKRELEWVGYKVHLTETCDPDTPHLLTNVETTPATTPDDNMLAIIHASLAARDRLPHEHLVDKGYTDAHVLVDSQRQYGVTIVGPVAEDPSWQAQAGAGFGKAVFGFRCLDHGAVDRGERLRQSLMFVGEPVKPAGRSHCTRRQVEPRELVLQPRVEHEALWTARQRQQTEAFKVRYAARAGIESSHAQGVRRCGMRQTRYIGLARTHLQHIATAAAINVIRLGEWWAGTPPGRTRHSHFAALQPAA